MTIKEVIEYIECGAIPYCPCASNRRHGGDCAGEDAVLEALKTAVKVLEKQIPKHPHLEGDGYDDNGYMIYDTWICPFCEKHYEVDYDKYDHCPSCGQCIDWSDNDGE